MRISYSATQVTSWLDSGNRLESGQYTYSVPGLASTWPSYYAGEELDEAGFALAGRAMGDAFIRAVNLWDELIAPDFVQVQDNAFSRGTLRIGVTTMDDDHAAYAYYPGRGSDKHGDIWFNDEYGPWDWTDGRFDFFAMLHEVGHTLGLKHSFEGNSVPDALETRRYTVLSYTPPEERHVRFYEEGGSFFSYSSALSPETPMVLDIAAIQSIYGADPDTRAGDTVYTFEQWHAGLSAIYDAGGIDTLDVSDFTQPSIIDLRPGAYSSLGIAGASEQIAYWTALYPQFDSFISSQINKQQSNLFRFTDNVAIALNTWIENATGGSASDTLTGNKQDNLLEGLDGNDKLIGMEGADSLYGGTGNDVLHGDTMVTVPDRPLPETIAPTEPTQDEPTEPNAPPEQPATTGNFLMLSPTVPASSGLGRPEKVEQPEPTPVRVGLFIDLNPSASVDIGELINLPDTPVDYDLDQPSESSITSSTGPIAGVVIDDRLDGGAGDDTLHGGAGRDMLAGGNGADFFLFDDGDFGGTGAGDADRILDFDANEGDRIDLGLVDAIDGGSDDAFVFIGREEFSARAGELRYDSETGFALVSGDLNGDAFADFAIRLDNVTTLSANNFVL